jgi:hypothetical protein
MAGHRLPHSQLAPHVEHGWTLLTISPLILSIGLTVYAANHGRLWLVAVAGALAIGGTFVIWRAYERACARQYERDIARAEELRLQGSGGLETFVVMRRIALARAIVLTIALAAPVIGSWFAGIAALKWITLLAVMPILAVVWVIAIRKRGTLLELSPLGVRAAGHEIAWRNVTDIRLGHEWRGEGPYLRILLDEPLPAITFSRRLRSVLSRGESDREIFVSLMRASESPAVIHDIALEYQKRMGSPAALSAARELEPRRSLTAVELASILTLAALFVHGLQAELIASKAWSQWNGWVAAGVAVLTLRWTLWHPRFPRGLLNQRSTPSYLMLLLILVAIIGLGSWAISARSLPDIGTRWLGADTQVVAPLRKVAHSGSKGCRRRIGGEFFRGHIPRHYCAGSEEFARLPAQGPMRLIGRESWFGMHIDHIEPIADGKSPGPE